MPERNQTTAANRMAGHWASKAHPSATAEPAVDLETFLESLLHKGQLTEAQLQVGRFDQQTTGMSILEALIARNWLSPEILNHHPQLS
jgi:hypothetical protein